MRSAWRNDFSLARLRPLSNDEAVERAVLRAELGDPPAWDPADRGDILRRAAALTAAHGAVSSAADNRDLTLDAYRRWQRQATGFHEAFRTMYPPELCEWLGRLQAGDPTTVEGAVSLVETDPYCFRSGYLKADLYRYLSRIKLDEPHQLRVQTFILRLVETAQRREYRQLRRLAHAVADDQLRAGLERLAGHADPQVRRRAEWMLQGMP